MPKSCLFPQFCCPLSTHFKSTAICIEFIHAKFSMNNVRPLVLKHKSYPGTARSPEVRVPRHLLFVRPEPSAKAIGEGCAERDRLSSGQWSLHVCHQRGEMY